MESATPTQGGAVDALVELLAGIDAATEGGEFYDRVCDALCRSTSLTRAVLMVYDHAYRAVRPVGSSGVDRAIVSQVEGMLEETPIAQRALAEGAVIEATGDMAPHLPGRYARIAGDAGTIACAPVAAGGNWLGIIFCDRGGDRFELTPAERETLLTLGRLSALVASVERGTSQRERAQRLQERIALTRDIHERVAQRLFGVALALGAEGELDEALRRRCESELQGVMEELRAALARPLAPAVRETKVTLRQQLDRATSRRSDVGVDWADETEVPAELESLTQSFLTEALRNADKHAAATTIQIAVRSNEGTLEIEVINDGVTDRDAGEAHGTGLGLRLAAIEALQYHGVLEFGALSDDRWRTRLVVPTAQSEEPG